MSLPLTEVVSVPSFAGWVQRMVERGRPPDDLAGRRGVPGKSSSAMDLLLGLCAAAPPIPPGLLTLQSGQCFGRDVQLVRQIGAGGMGRVYEGVDLQHPRPVAVKVLGIGAFGTLTAERALQMFELEAALSLELRHKNVVHLHRVGAWQCIPYLVFELLRGSPLNRLAAKARLGPRAVASALAEAAHGLAYVHSRGIVHGDVKPANLFWDPTAGVVKLFDFGLARREDHSDLGAGPPMGCFRAGTAEYMAPERWAGGVSTPQSDLFAMGVTLYEMLTGRRPFTATQLELGKVGVPHWPGLLFDLPAGFRDVQSRLLSSDPAQRGDAACLARALSKLGA